MNGRIRRWLQFNGVGLIGVGAQLGALALLERLLRPHYLVATALAVELAILHNFAWHESCVWGGRREGRRRRLARFHLSNGLVSIVGNLALMRLLEGMARWPTMWANLTAIAACSLANFALAEWWVFAREGDGGRCGPELRGTP